MNLISAPALRLAALADLAAGTLADLHVDLYQNNVTPTGQSILADFTVADFNAYAQGTVTWLAPSIADDGTEELIGTLPEWRPGSDATPNQIYGIFCTADAGGALLYTGRFDDAPLPMETTLQNILLTLRVRLTEGGFVITIS